MAATRITKPKTAKKATVKKGAAAERPKLRASHGRTKDQFLKLPPTRAARPPSRVRMKRTEGGVRNEEASDDARKLAILIATAALDKKAVALEILDVVGKVDYADFLVLMSGRSDRQVVALSQAIEESLRQKGKNPISVEGLPHASWVLMDYGDVVVHVFQDEARSLYDLEGLWMDARRLPVPDDKPPT